jgi:hypothetical protein
VRYVLSRYDYAEKDEQVVGVVDGKIVGPAADAVEDGETSDRLSQS